MSKNKIILASSSPRRRAVLEKMELDFEIVTSNYDEYLENDLFTYEKIEMLAYNKAKSVLNIIEPVTAGYPLILSADTVVVLNNKILGKPQDETEAIEMLSKLSNKKHFVVTSVCVINSRNLQKKLLSETSYVEFERLGEDTIKDYVKKYKPMDKAGAYGIQELPKGFVKEVTGSFENIVGLCPIAVRKALNEFTF